MAGIATKIFIGASLAAGLSAVAAAPAQALSIEFHGEDHIKSYTHDSDNLWVDADASYLTDGLLETNVELWFDGESPLANVGFTATEGDHEVKVESVTAADWANFTDDWLDGLFATYAPLGEFWDSLDINIPDFSNPLSPTVINLQDTFKSYLPLIGAGDPNIAEFSLDETGAVDIQMAGWGNLWDKFDSIKGKVTDPLAVTAFSIFESSFRTAIPNLQISEIAKVTINGETEYAYAFNAEDSGFNALDDGMSYGGIYSWSKAGVTVASVPEPSTMLGLMAVGGLVAASKRKSNKNA
jgi:hypothetical protein